MSFSNESFLRRQRDKFRGMTKEELDEYRSQKLEQLRKVQERAMNMFKGSGQILDDIVASMPTVDE